jgi:hypothetical protein
MFSAFVLTFEWLSIWPSAFKTTITVIALWTSIPTYLTLFLGRLLAVGNLKQSQFKTTTKRGVLSYYVQNKVDYYQ